MFAIAIHGGAGTLKKDLMTPEKEEAAYASLRQALYAGYQILKQGGKSLEAVEAAVSTMEEDTLFNAGKGSVFTNQGNHEMDAAIMCGRTLDAGAVSAVKHIKNPITLARKILDDENFIFLTGEGAEEYALLHKVDFVANSYFSTDYRLNQFKLAQKSDIVALDHSDDKLGTLTTDDKLGTVGAVALDIHGDLAAATSTGGLTNKVFGRVGDTPIIGAGTYANNKTCAISCTGKGEFFIKHVVANTISCLMEYQRLPLRAACEKVINQSFYEAGGQGGVIGIDKDGNIELKFNTVGMYRGFISSKQESFHVGIYNEALKTFVTV